MNISRRAVLIFAVALVASLNAIAQEYTAWSVPQKIVTAPNPDNIEINSPYNDQQPAISKEGLSLYFASDRPGGFGDFDIYVSQRASVDDAWGAPVRLDYNVPVDQASINTTGRDFAPALSPDGHRLYFHRPGICGGFDLFVSRRQDKRDDFGWEPAQNLGCESEGGINSPQNDAGPTFFGDEDGTAVMYFTSLNRPGGLGDFDIYRSRMGSDGKFGPAELMVDLSSSSRDTRTALRRDGLEMFISSERPGGLGMSDLWVSTRPDTSSRWSIPTNVVTDAPPGTDPSTLINTQAFEGAPALSWDAKTLYFYSTRPAIKGNNDADIYISTRSIQRDDH